MNSKSPSSEPSPCQPSAPKRFAVRILASLGATTLVASLCAARPETGEALDRDSVRKDEVGSLLPIPLQSPRQRALMRRLHDVMLAETGFEYRQMTVAKDPLKEFKRTGDRSTIPNPTRGGRGNNSNDQLTNLILGWLLYNDSVARDSALNEAEWLAASLDRQDHGHVQRHASIALAALAAPTPAQRDRLLNSFLLSYRTLQNSKFWQDENWTIGMTGVRPFFRAVGAAHRFAWISNRLLRNGSITQLQMDRTGFRFEDSASFLKRVDERLTEMLSFRKVAGDEAQRGWQTDPGGWNVNLPVTFWPYLDSKEPSGRNSTWFHYGQIIPFEMLTIKVYHPERFTPLFSGRAAEVAEWALEIGADFVGEGATGYNLRSRSNWFYPSNPVLQEPFRNRSEAGKVEDGEQEYCFLPAIYFVRNRVETRSHAAVTHVRSSGFTTFNGEVSFAGLMALWQATLDTTQANRLQPN